MSCPFFIISGAVQTQPHVLPGIDKLTLLFTPVGGEKKGYLRSCFPMIEVSGKRFVQVIIKKGNRIQTRKSVSD